MTSDEKIARDLIWCQMLHHPLPWRIESDWTEEVTASDGHIVAKTDHQTALAIIALAEQIQKELDDSREEIEEWIQK